MSRRPRLPLLLAAAVLAMGAAGAAAARTNLGVFGDWGAFSDPREGRCYAIATAQPDPRQRERQPYMTVGTWPRARINGQVYWQLARTPGPAGATIQVGGQQFRARVQRAGAWAQDARMDAAIKAALRSARSLTVAYRDTRGRRFSDRYRLEGAATALDAATLACAPRRQ